MYNNDIHRLSQCSRAHAIRTRGPFYDINGQLVAGLADPFHRDLVASTGTLSRRYCNDDIVGKVDIRSVAYPQFGPELRPSIRVPDDQAPRLPYARAGPLPD